MRMMNRTSTAWMVWLRQSRLVPRVQKVGVRGVPQAVAIVIAGVADVDAVREAVRAVTVVMAVAIPAAVADAEEGRVVLSFQ